MWNVDVSIFPARREIWVVNVGSGEIMRVLLKGWGSSRDVLNIII